MALLASTESTRHPREAGAPPNWLADAVRNVLGELRLFGRTYWGITVHPMRFAEEWASGRSRALNPLAFMATSGSLLAGLHQVMSLLGYPTGGDSFAAQILESIGPFAQYAVIGVLVHVALLGVKPKRRLLDSLGIALYAGGPAMIGYVVSLMTTFAEWVYIGKPDPHGKGMWSVLPALADKIDGLMLWGVVLLFVRSLSLGLAGLRQRRWVATGLATIAAMGVLAAVLGQTDVDGPYGIQVILYRAPDRVLGWTLSLRD